MKVKIGLDVLAQRAAGIRTAKANHALIKSAAPCHDAKVVGHLLAVKACPLYCLAAKSEDYTTVP